MIQQILRHTDTQPFPMKKLYILATLLLVSVAALAQDGKSLYQKYSDAEGIQAVYISPAMFRLIGRIPDVNFGDQAVNLAPLFKSMTGFYLLSTENPDQGRALAGEVDRFVRSGRYELLMEAKDDGDRTRIYTVGDAETVSSLVLLTYDGSETTFITLDGAMSRSDLDDLFAKAATR